MIGRAYRLGLILSLLLIFLAGCSFHKEYLIGTDAAVDGFSVVLTAERWEVVGSGMFPQPLCWSVQWGDGSISTGDDAIPFITQNLPPFVREGQICWEHTYTGPGLYVITVSSEEAQPVILEIEIQREGRENEN